MKVVKINQTQLGTLESADGGWKFLSMHPVTAELNGCVFNSLEEASDLINDDCISPCIDLINVIQGTSVIWRYKLEIL